MASVPRYPQQGDKFVDTNASNIGTGRVLSQTQDRNKRVLASYSKTLSRDEKN
jgi:hypothetical protein